MASSPYGGPKRKVSISQLYLDFLIVPLVYPLIYHHRINGSDREPCCVWSAEIECVSFKLQKRWPEHAVGHVLFRCPDIHKVECIKLIRSESGHTFWRDWYPVLQCWTLVCRCPALWTVVLRREISLAFISHSHYLMKFTGRKDIRLFVHTHIIHKKTVVLGWIISLSVEPGIEPATFRFQSKVLVTPLPSLHSSSTFLLLSLSLSFSLSLCFFLRFSSTFFPASRRERVAQKEKRVGFYLRHLILSL